MNVANLNKKEIFAYLILFTIILLLFLPMFSIRVAEHDRHEFGTHAQNAQKWLDNFESLPKFSVAHPFLLFLEIALIKLAAVHFDQASVIVSVCVQLLLGFIIFWQVLKRLKPLSSKAYLWSMVITISLLLVSHIPALLLVDRHIYFGYNGINIYNNPTSNLLKPIALASLFLAVNIYDQNKTRNYWEILFTALLTVVSALTKPNFIICLLPALGLFTAYKYYKKQSIHWALLVLGFFAPAIITLAWQYFYTYGVTSSQIWFEPFIVMYYYSDTLIIKFFASILYPLLATRLYMREALKDDKMVLAWLCFLAATSYTYFLAESGSGYYSHGNFGGGSEITLFVLFIVTTLFLLERKQVTNTILKRDWIISGVYGVHLLSGFLFYIFSISLNSYSEIGSFTKMFSVFFSLFTRIFAGA